MTEDNNKSITFYGESDNCVRAEEEFIFSELTHFLSSFQRDNTPELKSIFKDFAIEVDVKQTEQLDDKSNKKTKYQIKKSISKGLAFELLITHWFREADKPKEARANCMLNKENKPSSYADKGRVDVVIIYGDNLKVNIEVSSKVSVSDADFLQQLKGSLRHKGDADKCLLVTNRALSYGNTLRLYTEFMREQNKGIPKEEEHKIIVISMEELLQIAPRMMNNGFETTEDMPDAAKMEKVFEAVSSKIDDAMKESKITKDLLVNVWSDTLYTPPSEPDQDSQSKKDSSKKNFPSQSMQ